MRHLCSRYKNENSFLVLSNWGNCILELFVGFLGIRAYRCREDIGNCNTPFNSSNIYYFYLDQYHIGVLFLA